MIPATVDTLPIDMPRPSSDTVMTAASDYARVVVVFYPRTTDHGRRAAARVVRSYTHLTSGRATHRAVWIGATTADGRTVHTYALTPRI